MPQASRRAVLAAAGAGAVAAAVAPAGAATAAATRPVPTRAAWAAVRGSRVLLRGIGSGARVQALVREIADIRGATAGDQQRYSACLEPLTPLPDGVYRVSGSGFAPADVWFVNVGPRGVTLQALFYARPR